MKRRLHFLHLGFPKTGSTLLQRGLFARHPGINCVGKPSENWKEIGRGVFEVDRMGSRRTDLFATFFEKHLSSERINIYSEEHAVIGFGAEGICRICEDRISVAERLRFIAPSAEVIIVIRNQLSIIPSYWTLRTEGNGNVNSWISHEEERVFSELDLFLYSEIVNVYQEFFGVERVHVLLYEDLLEDPDTFVHQLCVMLGVDPRIGTELTKGRWIAKTRESAEMILKPSACEFLERRYCADNQKLQENTGLDLASHGYPH